MGFPWQEYWSELPFPSPGNLPDPGIEPVSPAFAGGFFIHLRSLGVVWVIVISVVLAWNRVVLFYFFYFYFMFKLYNIVLVLPNIEMNPPQVYMCSPS